MFSYNSSKNNYCQIFTIFGTNINKTLGNQRTVYFPTSPNSVSALPCETKKNTKPRLFALMLYPTSRDFSQSLLDLFNLVDLQLILMLICESLYLIISGLHCWSVKLIKLCHDVPVCCFAENTRSSAIAEGLRDASCQLKSCQLPRHRAETTCTTSPKQIEVMTLESYSWATCNKHVHSTVTRASRFHCLNGVINKPTTVELCISPVYRRLAVAKFSKSTM